MCDLVVVYCCWSLALHAVTLALTHAPARTSIDYIGPAVAARTPLGGGQHFDDRV